MAKFYYYRSYSLNFSRFLRAEIQTIGHRSTDTSVFMHYFGSFLLQAMLLSLQVFAFKGQNMKLTVKMLFTWILRCDAGPNCLQVQY